MIKKSIFSITALAATVPLFAYAQVNDATSLVTTLLKLIGQAMTLLIALAVLFFVWGVVKYMMNAGDEDAQKEARGMMVNGVIAIFVMVSVWGLVGILQGTFQFGNTSAQNAPAIPTL